MALVLCFGCLAAAEEEAGHKLGDTVKMGTWAGEEIEWLVIGVHEDGTCVLMSVKVLDAAAYNRMPTGVTWEECSLRAWLNGEFYETAFTAEEREKIVPVTLENPDNTKYGTRGGNATVDRVYLLSLEEVGRYFNVDPYNKGSAEALIGIPTQTALDKGVYPVSEEDMASAQSMYEYPLQVGATWWWLRSPGIEQDYTARMLVYGRVDAGGYFNDASFGGLRPVICVRF